MTALPIDSVIEPIRTALARTRAAVVIAPPGAGKTTRLPPALLDAGPTVLLQPRRAAARAVAGRIAREQGWSVGREVGYQIRFDRRLSREARLLVVTEGILTMRLQTDPLLSDFSTVIIDEFHERSIHADLALALSRQAWLARDDLRIVVMSATLDPEPVSRFLGDCPVFDVAGRTFPLDVSYEPTAAVEDAAVRMLAAGDGDVLCFLPGAAEIRRSVTALNAQVLGRRVDVLPLHGGLDPDEQLRVLTGGPSDRRRVVVATNVAETSVTVPGVTAVVDAGWQKVARYDAARGIDSLATERVSQDAADQRAGRAGRLAPGRVTRLWDPRDRLRPHREPDVHRIDLAGVALEIVAWGADPLRFDWYESPREDLLRAALNLLQRLGAIQQGTLTPLGRRMHLLPLHPRLARMLIEGNGAWPVVQMCAVLSERQYLPPHPEATTSDLLPVLDRWDSAPVHVRQIADDIARLWSASGSQPRDARATDEADLRRILLAGYPDRVGRRRTADRLRVKLATGTGAVMGRESGVTDGDFIVALDVRAPVVEMRTPSSPGRSADPVVRLAARVELEWLVPNDTERRHWLDAEAGQVRASLVERYDAVTLREHPTAVDPESAAKLLAEAWKRRGPTAEDEQLLRRLRFIGHEVTLEDLIGAAVRGRVALRDVRLETAVDATLRAALDREAPAAVSVPSGRRVPLEYTDDGGVMASVKLQELFGLAATPRIGRRQVPVLFSLLAPNGRPVQLTRDLTSFWAKTYQDVRRELRGRYPKHPWPEDPLSAMPTSRTNRRLTADQTKKTR